VLHHLFCSALQTVDKPISIHQHAQIGMSSQNTEIAAHAAAGIFFFRRRKKKTKKAARTRKVTRDKA
jgi:hypothetical protein